MPFVLSDRCRPVALLVLLGLLGALLAWGAAGPPRAPRPDRPAVMSLVTVVAVDGPGRFEVSSGRRSTWVISPADGLAVGDEVTVIGRFGRDAALHASQVVPAHDRPDKKRLGLVGLLLVGLLLPSWFRWSAGGLAIRG